MKLLDWLKREYRTSSASIAKERLHIVVAHQRREHGQPDYMPQLERELIAVIRRYVPVGDDAIQISVDKEHGYSALEVNVTLPIPPSGRMTR